MGILLTGYMAGPDNAYPGHPDGGADTCTGVDLNEKYATFAIPGRMRSDPSNGDRTNLKVGDVVLFTNKTADGKTYTSVGWATDIGALPHGDIDVAQGALGDNLGLQFQHNKGNTYVTDVKGQGDVSMERLGHISAKGFSNPNAVNEAIVKVNAKLKSGELKPEDAETALRTELQGANLADNLEKADKEVAIHSRAHYGNYDDARKQGRLTGDDLMDNIQDYMQNGNWLMGLLMMFVAFMSGGLNLNQAQASTAPQQVQEAANQVSQQTIDQAKQKAAENKQSKDPVTQQSATTAPALNVMDGLIKSGKIKLNKSADINDPAAEEKFAGLIGKYYAANPNSGPLNIKMYKAGDDPIYGAGRTTFEITDPLKKNELSSLGQILPNAGFALSTMDSADGKSLVSLTSIPAQQVPNANVNPNIDASKKASLPAHS